MCLCNQTGNGDDVVNCFEKSLRIKKKKINECESPEKKNFNISGFAGFLHFYNINVILK